MSRDRVGVAHAPDGERRVVVGAGVCGRPPKVAAQPRSPHRVPRLRALRPLRLVEVGLLTADGAPDVLGRRVQPQQLQLLARR
eukprot:7539586-Pyramimonas_sp.AAC.1